MGASSLCILNLFFFQRTQCIFRWFCLCIAVSLHMKPHRQMRASVCDLSFFVQWTKVHKLIIRAVLKQWAFCFLSHNHRPKLQKCKIVISCTLRAFWKCTQGACNIWFPQIFSQMRKNMGRKVASFLQALRTLMLMCIWTLCKSKHAAPDEYSCCNLVLGLVAI